MKRTINILVCILILMTAFTIYATASNDSKLSTYVIDDIEYTIEIDSNEISQEKKQNIEYALLGIKDESVQTYGLGCALFGHDYKYTTASVVQHKVYANVPRCRKQSYDVTYCEDCDYTEETLKAVNYIDCCPMD